MSAPCQTLLLRRIEELRRIEDLGPKEWPANGDFLVARAAANGELVALTEADIRLWMFWFGLNYILNR